MDLFDLDPRLARRRTQPHQSLPMSLFDGPATMSDEDPGLDPEVEASVLGEIGRYAGGTLSRVGDSLAAPDDYFRGLLVGRPGERVTGRDMLRGAGLIGQENNWGNFTAGLGVEMLTGPLGWLAGPARSLTPAGKAAQKLNLIDNAATVATKKAISSGAVRSGNIPSVARRTRDALQATGRTISTLDPATVGRPLYGTRTARRAVTLDDLIKYADDPEAAERAARELLGGNLDKVRNQTLAKSFGIGPPLMDPVLVGDWLGEGFGNRYADVLDTAGQAYRWSPVGRGISALFDNRVGGKLGAEEQLTNIANFEARKKAGSEATAAHTLQLARLASAHPEAFSEDGNRALGRYIEGSAAAAEGRPTVMTAADKAYVESRPELKKYADWWINRRQSSLSESMAAGLNAAPLQDDYGIDYLPRRAEAALEMAGRNGRKVGNALSTFSGDMLERTDAMQVPGGRQTIIDLSRDPVLSDLRSGRITEAQAADHIRRTLNAMKQAGQPEVSASKAVTIARILNDLPDDVAKQSPLFGQHPTEMIGEHLRAKAQNVATAGTLYDSLTTMAVRQARGDVRGGRHISLKAALDRLGLKSYDDNLDDVFEVVGEGADAVTRSATETVGASKQMRDRLSQLLGVDADEINLAEFSIPEEHVNRLLRARDAFESGEAASALMQGLDHYTAAWRGSILTWPSRTIRDLYSGAVSNWLEGALDPDAVRAAQALISEGPQSQRFLRTLGGISRYQGDDGLAQFYADLAGTGLLSASEVTDYGARVVGAGALGALPGMKPVNVGTILGELAPQPGRSWQQFGRDFMTWRSSLRPLGETRNPILRAGEQMNSLSDGINRLSGYLSLLKQGYDPQAAAKAMMRAHVDYSSLTDFEKTWLKRIFPWYSFQSRIFREVLRQLSERPGGRYGQMIQATEAVQGEGDDQYIPSDLRSQFAFPIPAEFGGVPTPGTQTYLKDLDFPGFDQINMIETPGTLTGSLEGTARQIAMQSHPALRMLLEYAAGQDFYTRRPMNESASAMDVVGRRLTGNPDFDVPVVDRVVENLPFVGRPIGVVRSLADTAGDTPLGYRATKTFINGVSGMKVVPVTRERADADAIRQIEESIAPYTREFSQAYIPEQLQPQVPLWAAQRMDVANELKSRARTKREATKKKATKSKKKGKRERTAMELFE